MNSSVKATLTSDGAVQIMVIDLVFSLDSIITAVGMVDEVRHHDCRRDHIGRFDDAVRQRHRPVCVDATLPSKCSALTFLVVVGVVLVAEGFGHHVPKGYIYFAMAFSLHAWSCSTSAFANVPPAWCVCIKTTSRASECLRHTASKATNSPCPANPVRCVSGP
jgi:hypothetical protein